MESLNFKLEQFNFDGPMDLLLTLVQKNKIDIRNLPISLLCDQYLETIEAMQKMDLDVTADFLVMASDLMLLKSKTLLPQEEEEEEDPRKDLAELLLCYQRAKASLPAMTKLFNEHKERLVKDTDEIAPDRSYVADQDITSLCQAIRRVASYQESIQIAKKATFSPMISTPIVPVELKIVGILHHMQESVQNGSNVTVLDLLRDAVSLPDLIAIFLGILELIKMKQVLICEDPEILTELHDCNTQLVINDNPPPPEENDHTEDTGEKTADASERTTEE